MGGSSGDEASVVDVQGSNGREEEDEEKIFVAVRLRPMSEKEASRNDLSDWECINNDTVILKNSLSERSLFPTAYTFDRVFAGCCTTKEVYEGCAKKFALSVVEGINATIFAYGQTSSGKTYTMNGIMEYAVSDIYFHMEKQKHRDFQVKFSAMEIYNEAVRDLLSSDATPLRLLDDPERSTIVEKLTEEKLRNWDHLMQLLSICEAHRQMGETFLNETSSRSHQIIRLTVESCAHPFSGAENSATLSATVNFVDLAGSERASQTLSAGVRLKEGCHINRSLLTLGTVIRKLSKGRNKHVPYRDSKLTRILQNSLGGNAKTSIICTMCPARTHVEQSKNTLLFATCAKGVSTKAHVNVVMSDKALVRHLQRELARLENELRTCGSNSTAYTTGLNSATLLREKELLIQKMDGEIQELVRQRDLARSQADTLLLAATHLTHCPPLQDATPRDLVRNNMERFPVDGSSPISSPRAPRIKSFGPCTDREEFRADRENSEASWKEVHCIRTEEFGSESRGSGGEGDPIIGENGGGNYDALRQKITEMQDTIDRLVGAYPSEQSPLPHDGDLSSSHIMKKMSRSRSCSSIVPAVPRSLWPPSLTEKPAEGAAPNLSGVDVTLSKAEKHTDQMCFIKKDSYMSLADSVDSSEGTAGGSLEEDDSARNSTVVLEKPTNDWTRVFSLDSAEFSMQGGGGSMMGGGESSGGGNCEWREMFERDRMKIIKLWDTCRVPLIHRSCFFLLFQGDPSDAAYLSVELRQLIFMDTRFRADAGLLATASKFMMREREMLKKQVGRRARGKEREEMYVKWGIGLDKKQRKGQLVQRLWRDTEDLEHVRDSAITVAKLSGFTSKGQGDAPKDMLFSLALSPSPNRRSSFLWRRGTTSTSQLLL